MGGYRLRCADCHGTDGRGVRGPDITQVWNTGRTDEGLFKTIRRGVPNSEMPAFAAPRTSDRDVWQMLAYLKTLAAPAPRRAAARQRRERREGVSHDVRRLPQGEWHRRPPRSRFVAHRIGAHARRVGWRAFAAAPKIFAPASSR